jgi:hypothetical protein
MASEVGRCTKAFFVFSRNVSYYRNRFIMLFSLKVVHAAAQRTSAR